MTTKSKIVLSFLSIVCLAVSIQPPARARIADDSYLYLCLNSVLRRNKDVFASNPDGLFRADLASRVWKRLTIPDTMPLRGEFAVEPADSKVIFYYATKQLTFKTPENANKIFGLYLSKDDGQSWEIVSDNDDYGPVFLHPNGKLYSATNRFTLDGPSHIFVSSDFGRSFKDITNDRGGIISSFFIDPVNPDLVCVSVSIVRGYVLQAENETYKWKMTRQFEWIQQHPQKELTGYYSTRSSLYLLLATLHNYFNHPFGNLTQIGVMDIIPDKTAYEFRKTDPKIVKASVHLLSEPIIYEEWKAPGQVVRTKSQQPDMIKLLDQTNSFDVWSVSVIGPDGQNAFPQSVTTRRLYESREREKTASELRAAGNFSLREIRPANPYVRFLDIGKLYDFSVPGKYTVQIVYDCLTFCDAAIDEWPVSFSGQPFSVTIIE